MDEVRKLFAIRRRTARIRIHDDVARGRVQLVVSTERRPVSGERAAVNLENQRVLSRAVEARWRHDPRVDRALVELRRDRQRLHCAHGLVCERDRIQARERLDAALTHNSQVGRRLRCAARECNRAIARHRELTARVWPIQVVAGQPVGEYFTLAAERDARQLRRAVVGVTDDEAAAISRPRGTVDRAIEVVGQGTCLARSKIHHIQPDVLVAEIAIIETDVSELRAVGRNLGRAIGTRPFRHLLDRGVAQRHLVDLSVERLAAPVVVAITRHVDGLPVP